MAFQPPNFSRVIPVMSRYLGAIPAALSRMRHSLVCVRARARVHVVLIVSATPSTSCCPYVLRPYVRLSKISSVSDREEYNLADVFVPGAVCEQLVSPPCNTAEIVALQRGRNFKIKGPAGIQTILDGLNPRCKEFVFSAVGETWEPPVVVLAVERVCALQQLRNAELLFN